MSDNLEENIKLKGKYSIGIDLGTTYSCVCVYRNGKVDVITNDHGNRITPSYVSFHNGQRYVGESAKDKLSGNPKNTVYDAKRLIGRKFNEEVVQNDIDNFSFKVIDKNNLPYIQITENEEEKEYCPEEISAIILRKLKEDAEKFLGEPVTDAVITVPAYFGNDQKKATIHAGQIAGLNVLRIINEPTAAAIAYKLESNNHEEKNILVYDLGGGTLDVTLLNQSSGKMLEVKSVAGDTHLGGEDFDNNISIYCLSEFAKKNFKSKNIFTQDEYKSFCKLMDIKLITEAYKMDLTKLKKIQKIIPDTKCLDFIKGLIKTKKVIEDISNNPKLIGKLKKECEKAKKIVSSNDSTTISIDDFYKDINFNIDISRSKFEEINSSEFKRCILPIDDAMNNDPDFKNRPDKITDVVLIGGSTRIPKIREILSEKFGSNKIRSDINPDEAVAYGAAIQAAILSGVNDHITGSIMLLDVTPLTLGIDTLGGVVESIIRKNTAIPVSIKKIFTTSQDNQPAVTITICEGERALTKDNNILGKFELSGIASAKKGIPKIEVEFSIDSDGIISVLATDLINRNTSNIIIKNDGGRLSEDKIKKMIEDAEKYAENDKLIKEKIEARNKLSNYISKMKNTIENEDFLKIMGDKVQQKILTKLLTILESITDNDNDKTKEYYDIIYNKLEEYIKPNLDLYKNSNNSEIKQTNDDNSKIKQTNVDNSEIKQTNVDNSEIIIEDK